MTSDEGTSVATALVSAPAPATPERLGGYALVKPLAQGGMADVFLGRAGDRHVAVKVLSKQRSLDAEACALFVDEARVVALLDHENIAQVLDVAVEAGLHYLAMEYVHGADLRELLIACSARGALPSYEVALSIVAQAAAGLDHAHRRCDPDGAPLHLVHRDVSLSNIMVGHDGSVKVVDFGIARSTMSTVHTSPGIVRGKASYMSPEQCVGDKVDHRTDVFALGIILYELTTGARCFHGKTDFDRMLAIVRGDYRTPSELVADYPLELEQVVRTALATDVHQRYPSCAAMIQALDRVMRGRGWAGGQVAIASMMRDLFGAVSAPWVDDEPTTFADDGAPRTVENTMLTWGAAAAIATTIAPTTAPTAGPTARSTRSTRLARGTLSEPWYADEDEAMTRGRPRMRRSSPRLAA